MCARWEVGCGGFKDERSVRYRDSFWAGREEEGVLLVPHAGETLYRAGSLSRVEEPV
jgi:hypothetical protein